MQISIVRLLLELESSTILVEEEKLRWHILSDQVLRVCLQLLLRYHIVSLVSIVAGRDSMPWEFSLHEIYHDVGQAFEVISPALLLQQM